MTDPAGTALPALVARIVAEQQRFLARVPAQHRARLEAIGRLVARELERRLRALVPGRFTAAKTGEVMEQARALVDLLGTDFGVRVAEVLDGIWKAGAEAGRDFLARQLEVWDVAGRKAVATSDLLDPGLLEMHEVSVRAYGVEAIESMRTELARGKLAGETLAQTWERMAPAVGLSPARAERIARTEQSFALHRRELLDLREMFGPAADDEWRKQLVTTFDNRTGLDSVFVNGQIRKLDEPFEDNEGRRYQHPPNRPNDREVMVFVPAARAGRASRSEAIRSLATPIERNIATEVRGILDSPELQRLRDGHAAGRPVKTTIGGRTVLYEPDYSGEGCSLFGDDGFLLGRSAFKSDEELTKTLIHELERLHNAESLADGVDRALARAASARAQRFSNTLFDRGRALGLW